MTESCTGLVSSAINGEEEAWNELFSRFNPRLRVIARSFRLNEAEGADAAQNTWLLLVRNIRTIRDPNKVGAWLTVTMRRQCICVANTGRREELRAEWWSDDACTTEGPEEHALRAEQRAELRKALDRLPERQRALLLALSATPSLSYEAVADLLGMSVGSIGPTRQRALRRLARLLTDNAVAAGPGAARQVARA
jgi:RNA polymerase sigma factor (sigma-70 family)